MIQKKLIVIKNFFEQPDADFVKRYCLTAPYFYGERDSKLFLPTGMSHIVHPHSQVMQIFIPQIKKLFPELMTDYQLDRAYINCFAPRELANFHTDCKENETCVTLIYYPDLAFDVNDGGCTEIMDKDTLVGVPPYANSVLVFDGGLLHRATPFRDKHRFTFVVKFFKD
jgi:hypothetical protein